MATITPRIKTIVSEFPELFAPRPLRIPYDERDEIIHTSDRPFCGDVLCGCHSDHELLREAIMQPFMDGLLTKSEAENLYYGRLV